MYTLKIQNNRSEIYELTNHLDEFTVESITGLDYPQNGIHISTAGTQDGGKFNSAHLECRNIVITVGLTGGNIEEKRHKLYRIFPIKSRIRLFFRDKARNLFADGHIENVSIPQFVKREVAQISIICPNPYWQDMNTITARTSYSLAEFRFPFDLPENGETVSVQYDHPVCRLMNRGDAEIGFTGEIRIESDSEPSLEISQKQYSPEASLQSRVYIPFPVSWYPDGDRYLKIYVNGTHKTSGFEHHFVTYANSERDLLLIFNSDNKLHIGDTVKAETCEIYQGRADRQYDSGWMSWSNFRTDYHGPFTFLVPAWYAGSTAPTITLSGAKLLNWEVDPGTIHDVPPTRWSWEIVEDGGDQFIAVTYTGYNMYDDNETVLCVILDGDEVIEKERVIHSRSVTVSYPQRLLLSPAAIRYDAEKDLMRIYANGEKLTGWTIESAQSSGGSDLICIWFAARLEYMTTVQIVSSIAGDDIRDYTDAQVDAGMLIVNDLEIANRSTGEYLMLAGVQLRPGDVIFLSTVPGDLHVEVTESDWMEPGTSLLYAAYKNGTFFKIQPGENILEITAETNVDFVSAKFQARQIFGGV